MPPAAVQALLHHVRRSARIDGGPSSDTALLARFRDDRDEAAFTALVRRHAGLVLAACRRVLSDAADVEDAFQATFLVLLRNATSIRQPALGAWLYRVAGRCAAHARADGQRRRRREQKAAAPEAVAPPADPSWREVCALLHAELNRLPVNLRLPLILCYLQGQTRDEAARQLGWPLNTLRGRLERGRVRLRSRLAGRGIELSTGLLAVLAADALNASPPLLRATASLARGVCTPAVASLAAAASRAASWSKVALVGFVLAVGVLVTGTVGMSGVPAEPAAAPAPPPANAADQTTVSGRVLRADGSPATGARLFVCDHEGKTPAPQLAADADGRFRFALPPADRPRFLLATADAHGFEWSDWRSTNPDAEVILRLPADVPIRGRVVDLQGQPVAGAEVKVAQLSTSPSGNLDEFLKLWAADKERSPTGPTVRLLTDKSFWCRSALAELPGATTAADGTFMLAGLGGDRAVSLKMRAAGMADDFVRVVTRPGFRSAPAGSDQVALSGPEPTVALAPSKPVTGTVRDAATGQPLAGIRVLGASAGRPLHWFWQPVETVTDAQGRYRLDGLPKAAKQVVIFDPGCGAAHMHRFAEVGDTDGFAPTTADAELQRGVVVSGQVTDCATGRPVRAHVVYAPLASNARFATTPGYAAPRFSFTLWIESREMTTGADGRYRLTALPGPGALFVQAVGADRQRYAPPTVAAEDRDPAHYSARGEVFMTRGLGDIHPLADLHAYRLIRPEESATSVTADFALDAGLRRRGRLIDADGVPVSGAEATGLAPRSRPATKLPGVEFTADGLTSARPRRLLFWHRQRQIAGTVVLRGDEPEPVAVTLRPLAAVAGRAVDRDGRPLASHAVEVYAESVELPGRHERSRPPLLTDEQGRFRMDNLPAGVPLTVLILAPKTRFAGGNAEGVSLTAGQTKDLGDIRCQPPT